MRALVRRAAAGDWQALEELARLEREVPTAVVVAGHLMHTGERMDDGQGYSYTVLGDVLGITRQAARQRLGRRPAASWYGTPGPGVEGATLPGPGAPSV